MHCGREEGDLGFRFISDQSMYFALSFAASVKNGGPNGLSDQQDRLGLRGDSFFLLKRDFFGANSP